MLVFSALKIPEISKSLRYVDFLNHMSPEKYHFKCYQWTEFNVCWFLSGLWGKRSPYRPQVVWVYLGGLPFNHQRRFSGCLQERSCHKMTITYHKNGTASCCIWAFVCTMMHCLIRNTFIMFLLLKWVEMGNGYTGLILVLSNKCYLVVKLCVSLTTHASLDKIRENMPNVKNLCTAALYLGLDTPKTNMVVGNYLSTVAELTMLVCIYSVKSWTCILVDIPCLSIGWKNNTVCVCVCVCVWQGSCISEYI